MRMLRIAATSIALAKRLSKVGVVGKNGDNISRSS